MSKRIDYFCSDSLRHDLKGKTVRGGAITGVAQASRVLIGLASLSILSRLLDKPDFGLVQMVAVFTGLAAMFVDAGLSMATVQRDEINHRQVSNLFWIASGLGVLIALIVAALSPVIGWIYGEPRLVPITLTLACSYIITGLGVQHQALLQRGMQFRSLAIVNVASQLIGVVAAVAWAWWRYDQPDDYWALVWMPLATAVSRTILNWCVCVWRPGLPKRGMGTRAMVAFGANLTGSNFMNYFARNADNFLIGWYWGPTALGIYAQAYKLLLWPLQQVLGPVSAIATPALSRLQNDPDAYRRFFRSGVALVSLLLVPIVFASLAMAEDLVIGMMGLKWKESVPVFLALGPAALMATTAPSSHWVYVSWGHTNRMVLATFINSCLVIAGFVFAVPHGPIAVAVSFSIVVSLIRFPNIIYAFHPTPLRLRDLLTPMKIPFLASSVASIATYYLVSSWPTFGWEVASYKTLDPDSLNNNQLYLTSLYSLLLVAIGSVCFSTAYLIVFVATPTGRSTLSMIKSLFANLRKRTLTIEPSQLSTTNPDIKRRAT